MASLPIQYISNTCRTYFQGGYPNLTPTIYSLSSHNASIFRISSYPFTVYILGTNFSANENTTITFGEYKKIPITFYSSTSISFVIPHNAIQGEYNIQVVNTNITGSLYSNSVFFTIE